MDGAGAGKMTPGASATEGAVGSWRATARSSSARRAGPHLAMKQWRGEQEMTSGVVGLLIKQDGAPVSEGARRGTGEEDDEDEEAVSDRRREGGGRTGGGGCRRACVGEGQARGRRWRGMEGRRR
jgi:hypothetical protein